MPKRFDTEEAKEEYRRYNRRIAARLKDARLENDLTQQELPR